MKERRAFFKNFFSIYVALVLQSVITLSVNLADNIMLGAYSEVSLSAVAAVNQIQFVYQQLLFAAGEALVMFCSQYWGQKQMEPMKRISVVAMRTALLFAVVLFAAVTLFPEGAVGIFTTDSGIIAEGARYLSVIRFTYLFFAVTQILLATLRSTQTVKIAFQLSVVTLFVNCGINYVLIFGHFGAPELGTVGAAVGTLTARIVETLILIVFIAKKEKYLRIKISDYLKFDAVLGKDYFKIALPLLLTQGLWGVNTALQTVILGHMETAAIAANSMASTLFLLVKSTATGASSTASVIIGKAVGGGDMDQVKRYAKRLQKTFIVIGLSASLFLFVIRVPVLSLYNLQPATKEMANTFLIILCVACAGMSYQMPTGTGIIRGGGDARFVMIMDLVSIWGIVLPLSFVAAFVLDAPPAAVVCCLNLDQLFKCVPVFLKVNYGNWIHRLTREQ